MKYTDFIPVPRAKNQRIFIKNILGLEPKRVTKQLYFKAWIACSKLRYYTIYTTKGFYSGYSSTPRVIVRAYNIEMAIKIAKLKNLVEQDATFDCNDWFEQGEDVLHNPTNLQVIELE